MSLRLGEVTSVENGSGGHCEEVPGKWLYVTGCDVQTYLGASSGLSGKWPRLASNVASLNSA